MGEEALERGEGGEHLEGGGWPLLPRRPHSPFLLRAAGHVLHRDRQPGRGDQLEDQVQLDGHLSNYRGNGVEPDVRHCGGGGPE